MKVRPNRVGEEIRKELVSLIRKGIKDPRVDTLVKYYRCRGNRRLKLCNCIRESLWV